MQGIRDSAGRIRSRDESRRCPTLHATPERRPATRAAPFGFLGADSGRAKAGRARASQRRSGRRVRRPATLTLRLDLLGRDQLLHRETHGADVRLQGGRDLLALDIVGVWSVPVSTTPTFQAGSPRLLFRRRPNAMWCMPAPDGRRFLEITPDESDEPRSITVDVNFLERLAP